MASPEAKEEHSSTGSAAAAPSVQTPNVEETAEKAAPETKSSNQTRVDEEDSDLDDLDGQSIHFSHQQRFSSAFSLLG